jgi:hypothetical protein
MENSVILYCFGVLYSFTSPGRFDISVNVHWLLFTVGTY